MDEPGPGSRPAMDPPPRCLRCKGRVILCHPPLTLLELAALCCVLSVGAGSALALSRALNEIWNPIGGHLVVGVLPLTAWARWHLTERELRCLSCGAREGLTARFESGLLQPWLLLLLALLLYAFLWSVTLVSVG